jgi:FkbM family methyltransferase
VFDIGAHFGSETIYLADKVGAGGKVVSIEAHPRIFELMSRSVDINNLNQVIPLNLAVSDTCEEVFIEDATDDLGNAITASALNGIAVEGVTIDSLCVRLDIDRNDFLKMNIEGAERPALSGMKRMIERTKVVSISCHDFRAGSPFFKTKEFVSNFLAERGWQIVPRKHPMPEIEAQVNAFNPRLIEASAVKHAKTQ